MLARLLRLHPSTYKRLARLSKEAEQDGAYRVAKRLQAGEAVRLDQNDTHVALEYAFLCYETKKQAEARRMFDRIRRVGDPASRVPPSAHFSISIPRYGLASTAGPRPSN